MTDWRERARRLAETLAAEGHLTDARWWEAFADVPRHVFVSRFLRDDNSVVDGADPDDREEWLATVYADTSLITQVMAVPGTDLRWPTSSSTRPGLMARMLSLLDVADGHRLLEIGTGTGYHAAVLCHRVGDGAVTSIDIHPALVESARSRLARLGYRPALSVGDGADGVAARAPYDRIIATCAVSTVPPAWIDQLAAGGVIVADIRGELTSNLTVLRKIDDHTVRGRFLPLPGHFMWLRPEAENPLPAGGAVMTTLDRDLASRTTTDLDPAVLDTPGVRFLLQRLDPVVEGIWSTVRDGTRVTHLAAADGSWGEIRPTTSGYAVTHGGPRPLWGLVEHTVDLWRRWGRPGPDRFGLTATSDGRTRLWLDDPAQLAL